MSKLSIHPKHERAAGGLSASFSASSDSSERNLSHSDLSLSGEALEVTKRSPLLESIIQQTINDPRKAAEESAMQTEDSSGVGSDLPTSELEFQVVMDRSPFQTSTPVDAMTLPISEYEFHVLVDEPSLQTTPHDDSSDSLRTSLPSNSNSDEERVFPAGSVGPGETTNEATQRVEGDPLFSDHHEVLNITPPQSELSNDARDAVNGFPFRTATPLAAQPGKRDLNPLETAARTRPRPPQCNERKLIKVRDGGSNAANDDVVRSGTADRLGQTEAPLTAHSRVVTGTVAGREIEFLVDSGCAYSTITEADLADLRDTVPAEVWKYTAWCEETEPESGSDPTTQSGFEDQQVVIIIVQLGALGGFSAPFVVDQSKSPRTAIGHNVQRELGMTLTTRCDLCTRHDVCLQGTFQDADASIGRACIAARQEREESLHTEGRHPFRLGVARQ